ncbi:MAG: ROK family protein [Planctomycetales bacterium]|nr:ROK family protein [Planctomycetales bacterium]
MTVLACDFGGRRIKLGVVRAGHVVAHAVIPAQSHESLASRLPVVANSLLELCDDAGIQLRECRGVGVSYPSIIDPADERILDQFGKFADGARVDLHAWAQQEFGLRLALENDARMALIGEWRYGAGRGCDNVVIVTLGTGLGAAAVIEGRLLRGRHGQAGILGGHLTVRYNGWPCVCGNIGCAETEASTSVLVERATQLSCFKQSCLAAENDLTYETVFRCAGQGDECAQELAQQTLAVWGSMTVNLIHAYDPELVILAGGVMGSQDRILPAIQQWVAKHAHTPWGQVQIVASQLGDHAALLAAEWLVQERLVNEESTRE